ncbi:MAG: hydrolase [Clostridiaceae bacterium]|nr:hydrolase [Clostridiaceae bacterium]
MNKKLKYLICSAVITTTVNSPVFAAPASENINSGTNVLQTSTQDKSFKLEQNIESLDNQIEKVMSQIDGNKKQIQSTQVEIKAAEKELSKSQEDINKEQQLFSKRIRAIYINGQTGYIDVILQSKGFADFISRVENVKSIVDMDKKITNEIKSKQIELNNKKEKLTAENKRLTALNNENTNKLKKLQSDKAEQAKLIQEAKKQQTVNTVQINNALKQVKDIRNSVPKYTPSRGAASVSSNSVIAYASNFLGTPYLWGGTTPAGFDCSGFTQYVYRHFGIELGRTTYDQINNGYSVPRDQLQPGDLVFYGQGGSPTHMGIYIGNGMYIHSPRTGDVIKISSYNRSDYITARRVM